MRTELVFVACVCLLLSVRRCWLRLPLFLPVAFCEEVKQKYNKTLGQAFFTVVQTDILFIVISLFVS